MKRGTFAFWSLFAAAAIVRVFLSFNQSAPDAAACLKHPLEGIGIVADDPSRTSTGQVFDVDAERLIINDDLIASRAGTGSSNRSSSTTVPQSSVPNGICAENLRIQVKTKLYPRFSYGDPIEFAGNLSKPFNFSSDNGRSFDYAGYLAKDDVYYQMKSAVVTLATNDSNTSITSTLYAIKRGFVANLESTLGEPQAALAGGLVVGDKAALGKDLLNDFRIVGLIHIVVLSGFNITIVGIALRRMLSRLPRIWGILIGGIGIALFGILVGGGATVIRSCFMAGIALIADLIRRDYSVERALAFAALIMLIANPLILMHDPSFQLSFLATIGLVLLAGPIESRLEWIPDKFGMRGTVACCLSTQIFVAPFILYMMGQISIVGVVVNILVLPFIPITMLAVFLTGASGCIWHPISIVIGWSAHLLLSYELFIVEWFARLPFAAAYVPPFSVWWVVGFYAIFICGFLYVKRGNGTYPKNQ
jgi:competence protein ComEC